MKDGLRAASWQRADGMEAQTLVGKHWQSEARIRWDLLSGLVGLFLQVLLCVQSNAAEWQWLSPGMGGLT